MKLDDPFAQLERSHRRLEERLDDLTRASASEPLDIELVREVAGFFARAVRRHEEDEEASLFPRLATSKEAEALAPILERLAREHREHEALHAKLDAIVKDLDAGKDARAALDAVADALVRAYRTHIEEEERALFPAARAALDSAATTAIVEEMDARRGARRGGGRP
ncbi:MAG TPA: hemerythrin domain-containing protein [Labilithrix sp.]|jgi:hemerythrin-like domain-containing protein